MLSVAGSCFAEKGRAPHSAKVLVGSKAAHAAATSLITRDSSALEVHLKSRP
jgi:hypothetical protein